MGGQIFLLKVLFHPTKSNRTCRFLENMDFPPATAIQKRQEGAELGREWVKFVKREEPTYQTIQTPHLPQLTPKSNSFLLSDNFSSSSYSLPLFLQALCFLFLVVLLALSSMEAKLLGASSSAIRTNLASNSRPSSVFSLKTRKASNFIIFNSSFLKKGIQSVRIHASSNGYKCIDTFFYDCWFSEFIACGFFSLAWYFYRSFLCRLFLSLFHMMKVWNMLALLLFRFQLSGPFGWNLGKIPQVHC